MTNWPRFFPMLLAAHLHLGAMYTASASSEDEPTDRSRAPAFSMLVVECLLVGAVFVSPALGNDRPGVVKGVVKSANAGQPLPGANVAVCKPADSTLVGGTTTDSTGHFAIEDLPPGAYTVVASFVGYEPASRQVALPTSDPVRTLTPFRLSASTAQMDGATVSAERPFVTTEGSKKVYNFEQTQLALSGKSAVDVLRDLPSLGVDLDGAIRLRGNQNVSIHVNGEPVAMDGTALIQYLQGLSGNDVKRVEVNPTPSARHDAEGTAGIVNLVLDRSEERGLNGAVSLSAGTSSQYNGSGHLGYNQNPWTLYGSHSYRHNGRELAETLRRRSPDPSGTLLLDRSSITEYVYGGHSANAEIDVAITPATMLSLASTASIRDNDRSQRTTSRWGEREVEAIHRYVHLDERLSASHEFEAEKHELSAEARYQRSDREEQSREAATFPASSRERQTQDNEEQEASIKIDYTRPQGPWTIETGVNGSARVLDQRYETFHFDNSLEEYADRPEQTNALDFREEVYAGYGVLQRTIGPLDAEVGLRVEHTRATIDANDEAAGDNRYTNFFPSASLTYPLGTGRRVGLSYTNRVDRPHAYQLSAFDASNDPYVRFVGNPNLEPEQVHKTELTITQKLGPATVTISPYARHRTNAIEWATTVRTDSVTIRTFDNYDANTSYGTELTSSMKAGGVNASLSGNAYRMVTRGGDLESGITRNALTLSGRANVTWTVQPGLRVQVSQFYRSPMDTGIGRVDGRARTRLSLEKTFWNDRATLGLRVQDPFDTSEIGVRKNTGDFRERLFRDWNGRSMSFSFAYRFGESDQKKERPNPSAGGVGLGLGGS